MSDNTTARPWKIELEHQGIRGRRENITIVAAHNVVARTGDTAMPGALDDAELIVRAVNSFDALVEALEAIEAHHVEQNRIKGRDESHSTTLRLVRAALEKARS